MEQVRKTIIFKKDLHDKIEQMGKEAERDFSGEVRWILKEYIKLKESK